MTTSKKSGSAIETRPEFGVKVSYSDSEVKLLADDYDRLSSKILSIETSNDKVMTIALAVISGGIAYGFEKSIDIAFVFLPVSLFVLFFYLQLQYYNIFWSGGYKLAIEEQINNNFMKNILNWEFFVQKKRERVNVFNISILSFYIVFMIILYLLSLKVLFAKSNDLYAFIVLWCGIIVFLLGIYTSKVLMGAFQTSYEMARQIFLTPAHAVK